MTKNVNLADRGRIDAAAYLLAAGALWFVLAFHLLPALLAGFLVHELVYVVAERLPLKALKNSRAKLIAVAILTACIVALLIAASMGLLAFFHSGAGSLSILLGKLAAILDQSKAMLPAAIQAHIPLDSETLQQNLVLWLRAHIPEVQGFGKEAATVTARVLVGMIVGALVSLHVVQHGHVRGPLASALLARAGHLAQAFRRVVFAQVKISFINTLFTLVYLSVVLPLAGIHLPLVKTMTAITFILGLIPVAGNLISNAVIVIVSLGTSIQVAIASLAFLVLIHKLEYFLNARIVGNRINARAWELLLAMLFMEAAFGLSGVIAAPIYYAYLKLELAEKKLL